MLFFSSWVSKGSGILSAMSLATLLTKASLLMPVLDVPTRGWRSTCGDHVCHMVQNKCKLQPAWVMLHSHAGRNLTPLHL